MRSSAVVYVDNTFIRASVPYRGRRITSRWCHLFAHPNDEAALHALAKSIGLQRAWFQTDSLCNHYDVTEPRRAAAVRAGAVEIEWHEAANLWMAWRTGR